MKKLPGAMSNQSSELSLTLDKALEDLKMTGAEAYLIGDFSQVTTINDYCQRLQAVKANIKTTLNTFDLSYKGGQNKKTNYFPKSTCRL